MKLGDYLKAINSEKTPMDKLSDDLEFTKKKYSPFIINKCLSFFPDAIIQSNNMNLNAHLDKEMQYDYLVYAIRKRSRYGGWMKKTNPNNLDLVKEYFGYSNSKAEEILDLLTDDDINKMKDLLCTGGNGVKNR